MSQGHSAQLADNAVHVMLPRQVATEDAGTPPPMCYLVGGIGIHHGSCIVDMPQNWRCWEDDEMADGSCQDQQPVVQISV